jgi:hypothetical protein
MKLFLRIAIRRGLEMNSRNRIAVVVFALIVATVVPIVKGTSEEDWPTTMTFKEPLQVGNLVLSPGTYEFQKVPNSVNRTVVMIYSVDKRQWDGMVFGVPIDRIDISSRLSADLEKSSFAFKKGGEGAPEALQYWFHPGWDRGIEFVSNQGK